MALLNIDFSYDDNVKRSINSAKSSLSTRISDYTGIKRNLNNMSSSTGNLTTANTYIQKKINSLQSKYNKLENFRSAVTTFNTNAEAADRRVANRINKETNQFYKREGIQTGILYTIGSVIGKGAEWLKGKIEDKFTAFVEWCKTTWEAVKQWYEDNKWWIDVVIDVVCVVAAVAAIIASGGVLATVFAVWGLAKAGADLVYDLIALDAYTKGDMERYQEMSEKGLKDFMSDTLGPAGEYLYYGIEIASAIYGIYKIGKEVGKATTIIFRDYKSLYTGNLYKGNTLASMVLSDETKRSIIMSDIKLAIFKAVGITNLDAATGQLTVTNVISASEWTIKTIKGIITAENAGTFTIDSIKITKTIKSIFTNAKSLIEGVSVDRVAITSPSNLKLVAV